MITDAAAVALPGGGNANDTWSSLSPTQRTILELVTEHHGRLVVPVGITHARTLRALARRGLTKQWARLELTERGQSLVAWRRSPTGDAWVRAWTEQHQ